MCPKASTTSAWQRPAGTCSWTRATSHCTYTVHPHEHRVCEPLPVRMNSVCECRINAPDDLYNFRVVAARLDVFLDDSNESPHIRSSSSRAGVSTTFAREDEQRM
ncbi:unnamed protein product [Pieris brassicae]|uniref:Uncharacterized protein n=1 Tax=Pieris brassicae TaxID=7116 RepID=A0A9P0XJ66_PIEBR|nr:unnamed protein product [Pieris brassicae]